ncbi:MAG: subclass B3 metallo-beta-lactamase [Pseudomonadota bacterium]
MAKVSKLALAMGLAAVAQVAAAQGGIKAITEFTCSSCKEWNQPQKPFKIYGNTYYVGTKELSALLVTSPKGHILLDGALPQSAPLIEANIKTLGFRMRDVKLIVNSHEHFDHAGGIAALQRASGAKVAASPVGARVLRDGAIGKDDPQWEAGQDPRVESVAVVSEVKDGEVLKVGPLALTAHLTPAHSPGGTTWSWQSCEKGRCLDVVYADSLTAVSADGYRFTGAAGSPDLTPAFMAVIDKVAALKCDIVVSTHPGFTDTMQKFAAMTPASNPFIDANSCKNYAAASRVRLEKRIATERASAPK